MGASKFDMVTVAHHFPWYVFHALSYVVVRDSLLLCPRKRFTETIKLHVLTMKYIDNFVGFQSVR